jgi:endonuclease YncB( thermonuclease family)
VVDGDTIDAVVQPSREWRRFRLIGFDTPETYYAGCDAERELGYRAAPRLAEMVRGEVQLNIQEGARDRYSRGLATLRVRGEDVGELLIREGLAVPYTGRGKRIDWCAKLAGK